MTKCSRTHPMFTTWYCS